MIRACINEECGWVGENIDCVIFKHDATLILCPHCHDVAEEAGEDVVAVREASLGYEWVRWLSGGDAMVLLMYLCQHINDPSITREALERLVHGWRANALNALVADDWKASVDGFLEVHADARLYLLSQGKL